MRPGGSMPVRADRGFSLQFGYCVVSTALLVSVGRSPATLRLPRRNKALRHIFGRIAHLPERRPMQIPLQISCEHTDLSEAVRTEIEREVWRLEECENHITGCRVAVVAPSAKHRHGAVYRINIWITIPPHENIVVSHQPPDGRGHEDVLGSIKDAFASARRQIKALAKHQNRGTRRQPRPLG
jgi:ribosome-associated translation inhibitor RaiA